jgi:hypothetical protein
MEMQSNNTVRSDERTSNVDMITPPDPGRVIDVQKSRRMGVFTTRHFERARGFPLDNCAGTACDSLRRIGKQCAQPAATWVYTGKGKVPEPFDFLEEEEEFTEKFSLGSHL